MSRLIRPEYPFSGVRLNRSSNFSIPNNSTTAITWEAADWQEGGSWWTSGTDVTIPVTGRYMVILNATFAQNVSNRRMIVVTINSTTRVARVDTNTSSTGPSMCIMGEFAANAGDTLVGQAFQNSGSSLNLLGTDPLVPLAMSVRRIY